MKKKVLVEIFKFAPVLILLAFLGEASAAVMPLKAKCETPRGFHRFVINNKAISVQEGFDQLDERIPASAPEITTRTRYTMNGYKKYFNWNQNRYYIHIEDKRKFSEIDDFVVIKNKEGHEITYPLDCSKS